MKNLCILFILFIQVYSYSQVTTNIIENGDFHICNENWEISGDFTYACGDAFYTHYNFSYGYGYNLQIDNASGVLKQDVVFPDDVTEVELELYHKITTDEIDNNTAYDILSIKLTSGSETYEVDVLSNEDNSSSYIHKTYNIPSNLFNDETVTLEFIVDNDGLKPTRFRVDDISLNVTTNGNNSPDLPDLEALNPVLESTNVEVGETINIACDVTLTSGDNCDSSKLRYYFSNDNALSSDDQSLGSDNVNSLDNGEISNEDKNITIPNVQEGTYFILFVADADEEIEESNESNNVTAVAIIIGNTSTTTGTLKAILSPNQAISNGAQWRVNQGEWLNHNQEITLESGNYTISYKTISGYNAPNNNTVTISENENEIIYGNYSEIATNSYGLLTVALSPNQAVNNGAKWKINTGLWNNSNETVTLETGSYTISYKTITGFTAPNSETITIAANDDINLNRNYQEELPTPSMTIIYPRGAGMYNGRQQYYDDAYVAGVKIRILAGLEYVPTDSDIELWYSLNNGNSWNYAQSYQGGSINESSILDVEWYCNSTIDSENVKIKLVVNANGQNVEATSNGVFEIHPANKYANEGFRDNGESSLPSPFTGSLFWWGISQGSGVAGHQCIDFHAQDWTRLFNTCGQDFLSPIEGVIISVDDNLPENCSGNTGAGTGSGNQITIQSTTDKTMAFKVLHLNEVYVNLGDAVTEGQLIGTVGSTGEVTTGPHAHISLYKNIYVSNNIQTTGGIQNTRIITLLNSGYGYNNTAHTGCDIVKNYHAAPFSFINNSSSGRATSSTVISDLANSAYTVFIPESNVITNMRICDINGFEVKSMNNVIMNATNNGSMQTVNIDGFVSGVYIITVKTPKKTYTHKIIKM